MDNLVKCKVCGQEIAKSAEVCPHCGAKQKKPHWVLSTILIVLGLFVFVLNISSISGTKSNSTSQRQSSGNINKENETPVQDGSFGIGQKAELDGISITLVDVSENFWFDVASAEENGIYLVCEFEIENNSDKDIEINSSTSFEAYIDDCAADIYPLAVVISDKGSIEGNLAAGKKLDGVIGYSADTDWKNIEIRFKHDLESDEYIVFNYSS